jgi:hypothetical protein
VRSGRCCRGALIVSRRPLCMLVRVSVLVVSGVRCGPSSSSSIMYVLSISIAVAIAIVAVFFGPGARWKLYIRILKETPGWCMDSKLN